MYLMKENKGINIKWILIKRNSQEEITRISRSEIDKVT